MNKNVWIIKAGGELLSTAKNRKKILNDLARLHRHQPMVFVHGGGPQIEETLRIHKVKIRFIKGRRVTTPEAMIHVERVLSGQVNKEFVGELTRRGIKAVGISGRDANILIGQPISGLGRAAKPIKSNPNLLKVLLSNGYLPVVSTVSNDKKSHPVNINADDGASAIAQQIKAQRLIYLTNISGVLDSNKNRIPVLKINQIQRLIKESVIKGGMIPKVESAHHAIKKGVGEVDILNGFKGIKFSSGTRIVK